MKILPVSMKSKGFYDKHSQTQKAIIKSTLPYIEDALAKMSLPKESAQFTLVDYGCSEGSNSIFVISQIVDLIRKRKKEQVFSLIFNDLPTNNFNKLFESLYQTEDSLLDLTSEKSSILAFASGQPFHRQVMPASSINFGYSSSAAHWLSTAPTIAIRSHIYIADATNKEKEELGAIAAKDWQNFLNQRACEMASEAKLVVTMAAHVHNENELEELISNASNKSIFDRCRHSIKPYSTQVLMDLMSEAVEMLLQSKRITTEAAERAFCPIYPRSIEELLVPLKNGPLNSIFQVDQVKIEIIECPFFSEYLKNKDKKLYAESLVKTLRGYTETFLLHQLCGTSEKRRTSDLAIQEVIDPLYNYMQSRIQERPENYTFFPIQSIIVLTKK